MNNIPEIQNRPEQLKQLAAQRQLYSDAKFIQSISLVLSVLLPIVFAGVASLFSSFAVYSALYGLFITIAKTAMLDDLQKSTQEKAAKIQQLFDAEVLNLDLSKLHFSNNIEPEIICEANQKYRRKGGGNIKDWYPVNISQLPLEKARIICQRANIWWDAKLRRHYSLSIVIVITILIVTIVLAGLMRQLTFEQWILAVFNPLTPVLLWGINQFKEQTKSATRLDELRNHADKLLNKAIEGSLNRQELEKESYSLQNEIYENRRSNPPIFDWFYSWLRDSSEELMNEGAEVLIKKLL